jgi:hypothetical protein
VVWCIVKKHTNLSGHLNKKFRRKERLYQFVNIKSKKKGQEIMAKRIRWGDLISPREMYAFTLGDAVGSLPTLLAMGGMLIGCAVLVFSIKKLLEYILLPRERHCKYVLEEVDKDNNGTRKTRWRKVAVKFYGSIVHLVLETLFFFGLVVSALFAAAIGDINIWQSPIGSVGIGLIGTYIFGPGLQQVGNGYFFFLTQAMEVGEYWVLVGGGIEGRVSRISPFFVEFMSIGEGHGRLQRVSMSTVMGANWTRDFYKEKHEPIVVLNTTTATAPNPSPSYKAATASNLLEEEEYEDTYDDNGIHSAPLSKKFE